MFPAEQRTRQRGVRNDAEFQHREIFTAAQHASFSSDRNCLLVPRPPDPVGDLPSSHAAGGHFLCRRGALTFAPQKSPEVFSPLFRVEQRSHRGPGIVATSNLSFLPTLPPRALKPRAKRGALFWGRACACSRAKPAARASAAARDRARPGRGRRPRASRTAPCRRPPRSPRASRANRRRPTWR